MAVFIAVFSALLLAASAAPPAPAQPRYYPSGQIQQINPLDYYLDNPDGAYYIQGQDKQADASSESRGGPSRLETLEPDSEVELIPGAQPPQQPPQQTPVAPNVPGILPGQRVFIVHMPVPGYRPGTIGGYQPVYIVAAAPDGNLYTPNGYQSPAAQGYPQPGYPQLGYARPLGPPQQAPGYYSPYSLNRPYGLLYPQPVVAYQPVGPAQGLQGEVRLSQSAPLQGRAELREESRPANDPEPKKANLETAKEGEERRSTRPAPPNMRTKA